MKARLYKIRNITDLKTWFCSCFGKRCLRRPLKGHMEVFQGVVGKLASGRDQLQNTKGIFLIGSVQRSFIGKQSFFLPSWKIGLHLSILSVSGEGYSRHALCALKISTFLLLSRGRYLCSWTISSRGYHPLRHCHSLLDIFITEIHSSKLM